MENEASAVIISPAKSWSSSSLASALCKHSFSYVFYYSLCLGSVAIVLAICIPRVPSFAFNGATPLVNATGSWGNAVPTLFSRSPANFSFPAFASIQVNTQDNVLPVKLTHMEASVYDLDTNRLVGTGKFSSHTLPAKSFPQLLLPLNFTYIAANTSDQTCECA